MQRLSWKGSLRNISGSVQELLRSVGDIEQLAVEGDISSSGISITSERNLR